uniref:Uncharacterized protein n=1 Tax=Arundo donax TaxID=35708 RepID=A0A0A8XNA3_ARUDO
MYTQYSPEKGVKRLSVGLNNGKVKRALCFKIAICPLHMTDATQLKLQTCSEKSLPQLHVCMYSCIVYRACYRRKLFCKLHGHNQLGHGNVTMSNHWIGYCCHRHSVHLLCRIQAVAFRGDLKSQEKVTLF